MQLGFAFGRRRGTLEQRFREFCDRNPHILHELERRALRLHAVGAPRIGVKAIYEAMRYDAAVRTDSTPKLDNSFTALFARQLIAYHPELSSVIETRTRRGEA